LAEISPIPLEEFGKELALNKWRRKSGAVTGVRILVLVVGNYRTPASPNYKRTIDNYRLLLNNTFGATNVVFAGTGFQRKRKVLTVDVEGEDFKGRKHLTLEEVESIIAFENTLGMLGERKYDQIHFISHGGPDPEGKQLGMLFLKGFEDPEEKTHPIRNEKEEIWRTGFDKAEADIMNDRSKWPINAGGKILLLGCNTAFGAFPGFLEDKLPDCSIHSMTGIFRCGYFVDDNRVERPVDWYSEYQHYLILHIAVNWLQIKEPPAEIYEK